MEPRPWAMHDLTQEDLAEKPGVTCQTTNAIEELFIRESSHAHQLP